MVCPKCNGKVIVMDVVNNNSKHEIYRKKKCIDCGHIFFTAEFEVDRTTQFINDWKENYRR